MRLSLLLYILVKTGEITPEEADILQKSDLIYEKIPNDWRLIDEEFIKRLKQRV